MVGVVGCVVCVVYWGFVVFGCVFVEMVLVDFVFGGVVEGEIYVFEVDDCVDGFFCEDFSCVLVDEVVVVFDGVEGVLFLGVFFDVCEGCCYVVLCCIGV